MSSEECFESECKLKKLEVCKLGHTTTMHDIYIVYYRDDNHDFSIVTASEESAVREAIGILIDFDHLDAETEMPSIAGAPHELKVMNLIQSVAVDAKNKWRNLQNIINRKFPSPSFKLSCRIQEMPSC